MNESGLLKPSGGTPLDRRQLLTDTGQPPGGGGGGAGTGPQGQLPGVRQSLRDRAEQLLRPFTRGLAGKVVEAERAAETLVGELGNIRFKLVDPHTGYSSLWDSLEEAVKDAVAHMNEHQAAAVADPKSAAYVEIYPYVHLSAQDVATHPVPVKQ